jgi:Bax protein
MMNCDTSSRNAYPWFVVAFAGACAALIFTQVVTDTFLGKDAAPGIAVGGEPGVLGARYGGRISTVLQKPVTVQYLKPHVKLKTLFEKIGYRLEAVRRHGEVPRVFVARLPEDLRHIEQPGERKILFIKTVLPLILRANEMILQDRNTLLALRDKIGADGELSDFETRWVTDKAREYGLKTLDLPELVRRVDIIPPSLALAQAAEESGWGTSRFAREGNAIFGQRIWRGSNGMVPGRREEGETFRVRSYDQLIDGVISYAHNLNGHVAYDDFRRVRERQRQNGQVQDGYELALSLLSYSERGAKYLTTIRSIMRVNGLQSFDKAQLRHRRFAEAPSPDA